MKGLTLGVSVEIEIGIAELGFAARYGLNMETYYSSTWGKTVTEEVEHSFEVSVSSVINLYIYLCYQN
jgi:hypothetical protein